MRTIAGREKTSISVSGFGPGAIPSDIPTVDPTWWQSDTQLRLAQ
jgi:hypothetical protein